MHELRSGYLLHVGRLVSDQGRVAINESAEHAVIVSLWLRERDGRFDEFVCVLLVVDSIGAHIVVDYVEDLGAFLAVQIAILDVREVGLGPEGPLAKLVTQASLRNLIPERLGKCLGFFLRSFVLRVVYRLVLLDAERWNLLVDLFDVRYSFLHNMGWTFKVLLILGVLLKIEWLENGRFHVVFGGGKRRGELAFVWCFVALTVRRVLRVIAKGGLLELLVLPIRLSLIVMILDGRLMTVDGLLDMQHFDMEW